MPQVSAVIRTFGRATLLKQAIDSVLAQTMADLDLIVVIDGHDPETIACIEGIADPRVRYIAHDSSLGPEPARDTGARATQTPWAAFLDDDDQ